MSMKLDLYYLVMAAVFGTIGYRELTNERYTVAP